MSVAGMITKYLLTPDRLRPILTPRIRYWSSAARVEARHFEAEKVRRKSGAERVVDYYFQADDPHSVVTAQRLSHLASRYAIDLRVRIVGANDPRMIAAPVKDDYVAYTRKDVADVAPYFAVEFSDPGRQPPPDQVLLAQRICAWLIDEGHFISAVPAVLNALWSDDSKGLETLRDQLGAISSERLAKLCKQNEAQRKKDGYVYAGTFYYGGEWFLGLDRLNYLEDRLTSQGALRDATLPRVAVRPGEKLEPIPGAQSIRLECFVSARSPYSYIAMAKIVAFAEAIGVDLVVRPVLPIVMRKTDFSGANPAQATYVYLDSGREARRSGLPFGDIVDCMGSPVEAVYSLYPWAREQGRGVELLAHFLRGVFSAGINAATESGLHQITEAAGLDWKAAREVVGNDGWRAEIDANLEEMSEAGIWGVPAFRVSGGSTGLAPFFTWGQDRLFLVEAEIAKRALPQAQR